MFAVTPARQSGGIGRTVLAAAEAFAVEHWQATTMEMTVIGQRDELIAWYERRGYCLTGERRPFPYAELIDGRALRDDLYFAVLAKPLHGPATAMGLAYRRAGPA
jgi:ribosomal protein S18 acetylase RimI-like enzyme